MVREWKGDAGRRYGVAIYFAAVEGLAGAGMLAIDIISIDHHLA